VFQIVGDSDCRHRPEDFLIERRHARDYIGQHGGRVEVARTIELAAAEQQLGPAGDRALDLVMDPIAEIVARDRPDREVQLDYAPSGLA